MASKHWIAGIVAAAVIGVGAWVYSGAGQTAAPQSTFVLLDGSQKTTADLKGRVTLVNFWATSCTTCVAEMPEIISTYQKYQGKGFDTLAVAMSYDPPSYVVNFVESRKLPGMVARPRPWPATGSSSLKTASTSGASRRPCSFCVAYRSRRAAPLTRAAAARLSAST
jgi:thiol-disulfide isomerase/thioredoxin